MAFLSSAQPTTDPFAPAIQGAAENVKRLIWLIIIIALIAWLWMAFAH